MQHSRNNSRFGVFVLHGILRTDRVPEGSRAPERGEMAVDDVDNDELSQS